MIRRYNLNHIEPREVVPGFHGIFVHSDNTTVAHWVVDAEAELPEHSHVHEQVVNVVEGRFELTVDGERLELGPGSVVVIPSGVPHSGRSVTVCRIVDVFHPVREEYR